MDSENTDRCKKILEEAIDADNTGHFIPQTVDRSCDYTMWRRQVYDDMTLDELIDMAKQDSADNPFE